VEIRGKYALESNKVTLLRHVDTLQHALPPYLNLHLSLLGRRRLSTQHFQRILKENTTVSQCPRKVRVLDYLILLRANAVLRVESLLEQI
jgi:hypothetical protein